MGCCENKEESEPIRYHYYQLDFQDRSYLTTTNITCRFCKKRIEHCYMPLTACSLCHSVLGHSCCVSVWRMQNEGCPVCKK